MTDSPQAQPPPPSEQGQGWFGVAEGPSFEQMKEAQEALGRLDGEAAVAHGEQRATAWIAPAAQPAAGCCPLQCASCSR